MFHSTVLTKCLVNYLMNHTNGISSTPTPRSIQLIENNILKNKTLFIEDGAILLVDVKSGIIKRMG